MFKETLNPEKTALLFFDMLNGHIKKNEGKPLDRYLPVIKAGQTLLQAARQQNMMVAYAAANHRADNATSAHTIRDTDNRLNPLPIDQKPEFKPVVAGGTWEAAVIDELAPQESDYIIPKYRWSAFFQHGLFGKGSGLQPGHRTRRLFFARDRQSRPAHETNFPSYEPGQKFRLRSSYAEKPFLRNPTHGCKCCN
jgi:nicotinamidase-related amidase